MTKQRLRKREIWDREDSLGPWTLGFGCWTKVLTSLFVYWARYQRPRMRPQNSARKSSSKTEFWWCQDKCRPGSGHSIELYLFVQVRCMVCADSKASSHFLICQSTCGIKSLCQFLWSKKWMVKSVLSWTSGFKKNLASSSVTAIMIGTLGIYYDITIKGFPMKNSIQIALGFQLGTSGSYLGPGKFCLATQSEHK